MGDVAFDAVEATACCAIVFLSLRLVRRTFTSCISSISLSKLHIHAPQIFVRQVYSFISHA